MIHRFAMAAIAAALLAPSTARPAQSSPTMEAEQGWSAVGRCAAIANERARHECLDELLRKAGLLTPQVEATERRRQFGLGTTAPASTPAPATTAPPSPVAGAGAGADSRDRLEATLVSAVEGSDRKVVLTTTDGAVWKQIDSETVPRLPRAGDVVKIRKGTLGSYLCEMPTRHTFRCVRSK